MRQSDFLLKIIILRDHIAVNKTLENRIYFLAGVVQFLCVWDFANKEKVIRMTLCMTYEVKI